MSPSVADGRQTTPLAEVLQPVSRPEPVDPERVYRILDAHWYAKGLYTKGVKPGSALQARTVYRVSEGDLVYNRLFAWMGSFAVASDQNDGCYVSNEFLCYRVDPGRLDARYLWLYFSRQSAWNEALGLSSGSTPTSRNRLKEERFLSIELPLPPLAEQRQIVAQLEELAGNIAAARALRRAAGYESEALMRSVMARIFRPSKGWRVLHLEDVCQEVIDNLHLNPVYADEGVPCVRSPDVGWGRLRLATALRTSEQEYVRRTVRGEPTEGDVVLVREGGGTGRAAIVEGGQRFSLGQRVMMLRPDRSRVLPRFLLYQLLSPAIQQDQILPRILGSASPHLNIGALREFRFLLTPLAEQALLVQRLDSLRAYVDRTQQLQAETDRELATMLPSALHEAFMNGS